MKRTEFEPNDVRAVLISHLHGDHFGGLPFLVLDGQFRKRTAPLLIAGPPGIESRLHTAMEALFPGSSSIARRFETRIVELGAGEPFDFSFGSLIPFKVEHASGAPPFGYRIEVDDVRLGHTGDTSWCEAIVEPGADADLLIAEAYTRSRPTRFHLSFAEIDERRADLTCREVVLTHMSADMLESLESLPGGYRAAHDGMVVRPGSGSGSVSLGLG